VRRSFSAADIEYLYTNRIFKVGDSLRLPKRTAAAFEDEQEKLLLNKPDVLLWRAQGYLNNREYAQAEDKINEVLRLDPGNEEALEMFDRIAQTSLDERLDELFAQFQTYLKNREYAQAEDKINEVLRLDPQNEEALEMLNEVKEALLRAKLAKFFTPARAYLKEMEYELAESKIRAILQLDPQNEEALKMLGRVERALRKVIGVDIKMIVVDIGAPKRTILSTAIDVLREEGCLITFSDPRKYNLQASKDLTIPFAMSIFADGGPVTRNRIYYSVEVKESLESEDQIANRLIIHLKGVYRSEGRVYGSEIKKTSRAYKDAEDMAFKIKYLVENL